MTDLDRQLKLNTDDLRQIERIELIVAILLAAMLGIAVALAAITKIIGTW